MIQKRFWIDTEYILKDNIKGAKGVGYKTLVKNFKRFTEQQEYTLDEFFIDANMKYHEKNKKAFRSILDSKNIIRRNWRLILLDIQNLSHNQIVKIDNIVENSEEESDKMGLIRLLLKNGIQSLNIERSFLSFKLNKLNFGKNK